MHVDINLTILHLIVLRNEMVLAEISFFVGMTFMFLKKYNINSSNHFYLNGIV